MDRCRDCGLDLKAADSGDGPAVFVILILGALVAGLVFWVEFGLEPPFWVHLILWPPVVIGGSLAMLRPLKGVMIALQFQHQAAEHRVE